MTSEMLTASQKLLPTWSLASFLRSHSQLSIPSNRIKTLSLCICAFGSGRIIKSVYLPAAVPNSSYSKGEHEPALPSAEVTSSEENSHQKWFYLCAMWTETSSVPKVLGSGLQFVLHILRLRAVSYGVLMSCFLWKMFLYKLENCYGVVNECFLSQLPGLK